MDVTHTVKPTDYDHCNTGNSKLQFTAQVMGSLRQSNKTSVYLHIRRSLHPACASDKCW
jgi:hypothetical protein